MEAGSRTVAYISTKDFQLLRRRPRLLVKASSHVRTNSAISFTADDQERDRLRPAHCLMTIHLLGIEPGQPLEPKEEQGCKRIARQPQKEPCVIYNCLFEAGERTVQNEGGIV